MSCYEIFLLPIRYDVNGTLDNMRENTQNPLLPESNGKAGWRCCHLLVWNECHILNPD